MEKKRAVGSSSFDFIASLCSSSISFRENPSSLPLAKNCTQPDLFLSLREKSRNNENPANKTTKTTGNDILLIPGSDKYNILLFSENVKGE
jgi:hypothetical protein